MVATAQIQRKILDFTLGVTNKAQVINHLKSHRFKYSINNDGDIVVDNVAFAGHNWPGVFLNFYNGIFYLVSFRDNESFTPKEIMESVWKRIRNTLNSKYHIYLESSNENEIEFSDNKTTVSLKYEYIIYNKSLSIMYYDVNLFIKKIKSDDSEL